MAFVGSGAAVSTNSPIVKSRSTHSDLMGTAPPKFGTDCSEHPGVSILGLGDGDFPQLRPSVKRGSGKYLGVSKAVTPAGEPRARQGTFTNIVCKAKSEAIKPDLHGDALLSSVPTRSRPIRSVSRTGKGVLGKSRGDTEALLPSEDFKASQNWRSLFVNRPKSYTPLVFSNPTRVDGKVIINPPVEAVVKGVGIWEGCLVGQFFDKLLPLHVVRSLVERLWGKHDLLEISTIDNGLYIFRFMDRDARYWVLENGPWYFFGRPIILRIWKPGMEMLNVHITSLPIWVKFFNIPLEYWTVTSLGYIASAVGIPLHLNTLTENHSRYPMLGYALRWM